FAPRLISLLHLDTSLLAQDEVPVVATEPLYQRHGLKAGIAQQPHVTMLGNEAVDVAQERQLLFNRDMAAAAAMHAPGQRQGAFAIGYTHRQQAKVQADSGA